MKPVLTQREKVLLVILAVLSLFGLYYLLFYIPTQEKITACEEATLAVEDSLVLADAKVEHMKKMEAELRAIFEQDPSTIRELPPYDNSRNVMRDLYTILGSVQEYNIAFATVSTEDSTVRRNIEMDFVCSGYAQVREILQRIHDGAYRCMLKDLIISYDPEEGYRTLVSVTYFEYA